MRSPITQKRGALVETFPRVRGNKKGALPRAANAPLARLAYNARRL
jgi:hypothetical protein